VAFLRKNPLGGCGFGEWLLENSFHARQSRADKVSTGILHCWAANLLTGVEPKDMECPNERSNMASIAISSASPTYATQASASAKTTPEQAGTMQESPAVLKPDTVKLSPMAQAKMMYRTGQSLTLIASTLGTSVATIDGYLNIKVATQAAATPTPAPAAQAEPAKQTAPAEQATPGAPPVTGKK
jgi:hypothetical protein